MASRITKPIRPGTVIRFQGEASTQVPPSVAETVAVPIVHDWGPANMPVLLDSFPDFEARFGSTRTAGRNAILGAFAGQALPGQGGAGGVYVYRMAPGALPAQITGVGGVAPAGLNIVARHTGTRGNALTVIIEADPSGDVLKQQCRITYAGGTAERYSFLKAQPEDLVNAIANSSANVYANTGAAATKSTVAPVTAMARWITGRTVAVDIAGAKGPARIDWGDGTPVSTELSANTSTEHTYTSDSSKTITITSPGVAAITLTAVLPWPAPADLVNASVSLAGGTSGDTGLTVTDWDAALTAMEYLPFSVIAPYDLPFDTSAPIDNAVRSMLVAWVDEQDAANRPVMLVLGGHETETPTDAMTDARTINNHHVVRLAGGYFRDDVLGTSVTTSQFAPRVAGMLAALGDANSLTFKSIGGLTYIGSGYANDQIESTIQNGVTTVSVSTNPVAPLRIERGLTTFVTVNDPTRPLDFFSDPRLVRLVDLFIRRMKEWGDNTMIGNVPVNDDSRSALRAQARSEIDNLLDRGLVVPGTDFLEVPVPTDPDLLDSLIYEFGFQCARTALYIFGFGSVR